VTDEDDPRRSTQADTSPVTNPEPPAQVVYVQQAPVPTNAFAVAALVLGIVGAALFWTIVPGFLLGLLATVFGAIGLSRARRGAPNKGMAIAGLVLGILTLLTTSFFLSTALVSFDGGGGVEVVPASVGP
jgi:hypothetical protein